MNNALPNSWILAPLLEVVTSVPTGVPDFKGAVDYYSTGSIQNGDFQTEGQFTIKTRPSRANRWATKGDVLQARMQFTNKALLIDEKFDGKLFSTGFLQLRPDFSVCAPRFLKHYVASQIFLNQRDELATGSTQIALTDAAAKELSFPLAPINEQNRIVAKLEKVLGAVEDSQKRLAKIPVLLKRFRQSVLVAACSGHLTADWRAKNQSTAQELDSDELPRSWSQTKLGEVLETLTDYHANGSYESLKEHVTILSEKDYAIYVRATNLESKSFEGNVKYVSKAAYDFLSKSKVFGDEIIIGKIGNAGKVYFMPNLGAPCTLGMNLFLLRIKPSAQTKYIYYHLISPSSEEEIRQNIKGATNQSIDKKSIRGIPLNLPLVPEQEEIVRRVEALFALAEKIEARYKKAQAQVDKLTQSVLAKAFRGELVTQDPTDEPASVLLEKIKMKNSEVGNVKRRTKRNN